MEGGRLRQGTVAAGVLGRDAGLRVRRLLLLEELQLLVLSDWRNRLRVRLGSWDRGVPCRNTTTTPTSVHTTTTTTTTGSCSGPTAEHPSALQLLPLVLCELRAAAAPAAAAAVDGSGRR